MSLATDLRVLWHLVAAPVRGATHRERLDAFYAGQAADYDAFRTRLLPGRCELYRALPTPERGTWVELGGGTASNLEYLGDRLARLQSVHVVDLSASLLEIARQRCRRFRWTNVVLHEDDATTFDLPDGRADVVTLSFALTMIPDWFTAIDNAARLLKPGGVLGVVDFFVARKHADGLVQPQSWWTRSLWPTWFAADNVFLSPDHLPYLQRRFDCLELHQGRARLPYLPLARAPYYRFLGVRKA